MKAPSVLVLLLAGLAAGAPAGAGVQYYVDPLNGVDTPANGSQPAPWKTVAYAVGRIIALPPAGQAGLVLSLRANALYPSAGFPPTMHGTPTQPIVVQPYDGPKVVFDGGEARFRQPGAWEPVPGQAGEWRTKDTFTTLANDRIAWGQMMDTKLRLVTYSKIEDMRATNESFHSLPLSDHRPAFGPLAGDETHKFPFTYLGPGVFYNFESPERTIGRVHLRLSSTHIGALGIQDYVGGGDPNPMNLSIARRTSIAVGISAQNIVFKNLVFQNGGETTLQLNPAAQNVTFDHCEVYGGRYGVRIAGGVTGLKFHHCTFDGGLASWTSRSDVKNEYDYFGTPECPIGSATPCHNSMGAKTHDILIIHGASQSEYVNCTFRHAHDGIQFTGDGIEIRDSLFEDLNDEVLQINRAATNVKIHGNVIRQALNPVSFALGPTGGPVYFYRNVVDQRVPTRGYRTLPPDAPTPWIWRYGADFKDVPTLEFHCYQNTFFSSRDVDKSSYTSHLFYSDPPVAPTYLNNIHLVLEVDRPLSRVPSAAVRAVSDGNIWYRYTANPDPLHPRPLWVSTLGQYFTLPELWADFPAWEQHSQYVDPQLANFTDEYFESAIFGFPNTDYRPVAGGPADGHGLALPSSLPDDFVAAGAPDVGARPVDAPVMAVGVDAATRFPAAGTPVALAGPDQTIVDADGDGFEHVSLDGSASHDPDGLLSAYFWLIGGEVVAHTAVPLLDLPEGEHYLHLIVLDSSGKIDSDAVLVRVVPAAPGENRLACPGFEETPCEWDLGGGAATTGAAGTRHSGKRALQMSQNGSVQTLRQRVPVSPGTYTVSGWMQTESLVSAYAVLLYRVLDVNGAVLQAAFVAAKNGSSSYSYHQAQVAVPPGAASLEVIGATWGAGSGKAFFDDLRLRDRNLLRNGRFEERSPSGQEDESPGWGFARGGAIIDVPADVRSGRHALALAPYGNYHFITQEFAHTSPTGYRVSGWIKTSGLAVAPTYNIRFLGSSGQNMGTRSVAAITSEGAYAYVSHDFLPADIPAGAASISVELRLDEVTTGTAFFDDLMVEPLP